MTLTFHTCLDNTLLSHELTEVGRPRWNRLTGKSAQ